VKDPIPNEHQIPHDTQLEEYIIGCMLYDPSCIAEIIPIVKPQYFYHRSLGNVCKKIIEVWSADEKSVNLITLEPVLTKNKIDIMHMTQVMGNIAQFDISNVTEFAERLRDITALRSAVKIASKLIESSNLRDSQEIRAAINKAESRISRITSATTPIDSTATVSDILREHQVELEHMHYASNGTGISGISSGLPDLDRMTAGFQRTDLIIVAARPSVGKTAFVGQLAQNMSADNGEPGMFFSLEMSKKQLVQRMIANAGMIDMQRLRTGMLLDEDWLKYTEASSKLDKMNLVIDDQPGITIPEIKSKARKVQKERGLAYIIIDYLQLIKGEPGMNRYETVTYISQNLKGIAKEFDVPVIALSQLSRKVEDRGGDKRPQMSDLRESGAIEQDADIVAFLHRDDYYNADAEKKGIIEVILAKQRNGPVGTVELAFLKQYGRILTLDRVHEPPVSATPSQEQSKYKPIPDMYRGKAGKR
jgi:replicative DNA helicase